MRFIANADYEETDTRALFLEPGDEVTAGPVDRVWPGWIWAENVRGERGYVPTDVLEHLGADRYAAIATFDPTVLTVRRGDELESLRQVHDWHWCRNLLGDEGWVAAYLLRSSVQD